MNEGNPLTTIKIGVVAHTARMSHAQTLSDKVDATVVSFDDGMLGAQRNHIKVWTNLVQHGADWLVVLEDDAVPVDDFRYQLRQALINAPTDIVSLYLGTGYPKAWQRFIKKAVTEGSKAGANYIVSTHLLHGVGTAIRYDLAQDMLRMLKWMNQDQRQWPLDEQITDWARRRGHKIAYTKPSLVNHMDGPSTIKHPDGDGRELPRHAWEVGTRHTWNGLLTADMP